jgi:hypothetical protein
MHRRMQDSGTVEISNPMFLKDEGDEDHSEPSLIFDSDKVILQNNTPACEKFLIVGIYFSGTSSRHKFCKSSLRDNVQGRRNEYL